MGQALSKNPVREVTAGSVVIAALCIYLEKYVNAPHQVSDDKDAASSSSSSSSSSPSSSSSGMKRNMSLESLTRVERLARAKALKRSTPKNFKMVLKSFARCCACIAVLDVLFARRSNARYFALHALVNACVVTGTIPDLIKSFLEPKTSMEGQCNVYPVYMILSLFVYHIACFPNVPYDEWWHHLLFGIGIGGVGLHYCPGPLSNSLAFFISGLPGGLDYAMLAGVKDGVLKPNTEKFVNAWFNTWVRGPGLTITGFTMYVASKYGQTSMHPLAALVVGGLSFFNGNYYAARVLASAGSNRYRPS